MENKVLPEIGSRKSESFFQDKDIEKEKLDLLISAAKSAPSSFNNQPWNYLFIHKNDKNRKAVENTLAITNSWAKKAPYLVIVFSGEKLDSYYNNIPYYLYDCGLSVMNFVTEAVHQGLSCHQMAGFNLLELSNVIGLKKGLKPIVVIALGYSEDLKKVGLFSKLTDKMKQRIIKQRKRKDISENFFFGSIKKSL